jgi:branched-subunit amino acid aminotransferase/4-amino-4-deoxychorismate lyase
MTGKAYICINGEFTNAALPALMIQNRAFRYGDALYENLHAYGTEPQFSDLHLERLFQSMRLLSMDIPPQLSVAHITRLIGQLLNKNRIFGGAWVRLTVYRDTDERFVPDEGRISFILESQSLDTGQYELNEKGLSMEVCNGFTKSYSPVSHLRNAHGLLYLLAGMEGRRQEIDTYVLLNDGGRLVETIDSNLFLVSGNSIFTPAVGQGCIPGVMRRIVVTLGGEAGYRVNDQSSLTPAALDDAEEIFTTNAINGIRWIGAFRQRRYYRKTARELTARLNEKAFGRGK